jgi:hypothetical protein
MVHDSSSLQLCHAFAERVKDVCARQLFNKSDGATDSPFRRSQFLHLVKASLQSIRIVSASSLTPHTTSSNNALLTVNLSNTQGSYGSYGSISQPIIPAVVASGYGFMMDGWLFEAMSPCRSLQRSSD